MRYLTSHLRRCNSTSVRNEVNYCGAQKLEEQTTDGFFWSCQVAFKRTETSIRESYTVRGRRERLRTKSKCIMPSEVENLNETRSIREKENVIIGSIWGLALFRGLPFPSNIRSLFLSHILIGNLSLSKSNQLRMKQVSTYILSSQLYSSLIPSRKEPTISRN